MKAELIHKANLITQFRNRAEANDTLELQIKRKKFLKWLTIKSNILVLEKYPYENDDLKTPPEIYQYFNKFYNTRQKTLSETCAEIDELSPKDAKKIIYTIRQSLINNKIHFAVFYAEGQRSPHVRIYDFDQLKTLTPFQREKAQAQFWRKITPWAFHYLDHSLWIDEHNMPLEFAPHWKYGSPFKLIMEWLP